jgi:hypothetical protein
LLASWCSSFSVPLKRSLRTRSGVTSEPAWAAPVANYFGNEGNHIVAIAIIVATVAFIIIVLKPFRAGGQA